MQIAAKDLATLGIGDIVTLRDKQTILAMMKEHSGDFTQGLDLEIKNVKYLAITDGDERSICDFWLYETDKNLVLVAKICGDDFKLNAMFSISDLPEGKDREGWLEAGHNWLFMRPENPHKFDPADLVYADFILNQKDGQPDHKYDELSPTMSGKMSVEGIQTFVQVKEWNCPDQDCTNPEAMLLEIGGVDDPNGGAIRFYQGAAIAMSDVDVLCKS